MEQGLEAHPVIFEVDEHHRDQQQELGKCKADCIFHTLVSDAERFLRQRTGTKDGGHRIGHIPPASCALDCPVSAITQGREKRDLFLAGRTYPVDS